MKKKTLILIFLLFLITLASFVIFWPDNKVHLIACDVGQGDGILITKGFTQILIDGGPNDRILGCLARNMPFWDRTIELLINTHQDKDHLYGLNSVIKRYSVKSLFINSTAVESKLFADFHQQVLERKIKFILRRRERKLKSMAFCLVFCGLKRSRESWLFGAGLCRKKIRFSAPQLILKKSMICQL